MKEPRAYEHIVPDLVGNRRRVLVSDLSGQSNVRYKAEELGIKLTEKGQAKKAVQRIKELEHLGYEFEGAEASFELLIRTIQGEDTDYFNLERLRVRSEDGQGGACSEATLAIDVGDHRALVAAEGSGPVDAMSNALREALLGFYPELNDVRLSDYKVRVLNPEEGTAAQVRVLIEHHVDGRSWHTVGVSNNIIDASWQALSDGIRYHLLTVGAELSAGRQDVLKPPRQHARPAAARPTPPSIASTT
jgi:2-isopropylmalate synthase